MIALAFALALAVPTQADLRLASSQVESAPRSGGRFELRARFTPRTDTQELREGGDYAMLARFAQTKQACGPLGTTVFKDGFE